MPNRTVYIRNADVEKWDKKYSPRWLHEKINEDELGKPAAEMQQEACPKGHLMPLGATKCMVKGCPYGFKA